MWEMNWIVGGGTLRLGDCCYGAWPTVGAQCVLNERLW